MNKPIPPPLPYGAKKLNKSLKLWKLKYAINVGYELGWLSRTPGEMTQEQMNRLRELQFKVFRLEQGL